MTANVVDVHEEYNLPSLFQESQSEVDVLNVEDFPALTGATAARNMWQKVLGRRERRQEAREKATTKKVVGQWRVKREVMCCVCMSGVAGQVTGIRCCEDAEASSKSPQHFVCSECLDQMTQAYCRMDDDSLVIGKVSAEHLQALVTCPGRCGDKQCTRRFPNVRVARLVSDDAFAVMQSAITKLTEQKIMRSFEEELQKRMDAEFSKRSEADTEHRYLERQRAFIIDNILNLRCPRCHLVFAEFDGCFAIYCGSCGCGFCAYCLKDCGTDAHEHVLTCKYNPNHGNYGFDQNEFNAAQRLRRRDVLKQYIADQAAEWKQKLRELVQPDLNGLGLDVEEAFTWALGQQPQPVPAPEQPVQPQLQPAMPAVDVLPPQMPAIEEVDYVDDVDVHVYWGDQA